MRPPTAPRRPVTTKEACGVPPGGSGWERGAWRRQCRRHHRTAQGWAGAWWPGGACLGLPGWSGLGRGACAIRRSTVRSRAAAATAAGRATLAPGRGSPPPPSWAPSPGRGGVQVCFLEAYARVEPLLYYRPGRGSWQGAGAGTGGGRRGAAAAAAPAFRSKGAAHPPLPVRQARAGMAAPNGIPRLG